MYLQDLGQNNLHYSSEIHSISLNSESILH